MSYKPTHEDLLFSKSVYDNIILTQTLNPVAVKEAYRRLFGHEAINLKHARIKVFSYFQYEYKQVDTVTNLVPKDSQSMGTVENLETQSHSEDVLEAGQQDKLEEGLDELPTHKPKRGPKKKN